MNKVNHAELIEAGKATRFGIDWPGRRCGAKTRSGGACQNPAIKGRSRCKLHGGRSTGPRTPEGKARVATAHTTHGRRSKAHVARVKEINAELRRITYELRRDGLIPYPSFPDRVLLVGAAGRGAGSVVHGPWICWSGWLFG